MSKHIPFVVLVSLVSLPAWSDVAPIESAPCQAKKASDSCTLPEGANGTCQDAKCTRLDYSNGTPPTSVEYACLKCVQGPATGTTGTTTRSSSPMKFGCSSVSKGLLALFALIPFGLRLRSRKA